MIKALEHENCFQGADNITVDRSQIVWTFHGNFFFQIFFFFFLNFLIQFLVTHHFLHSRFIPRRAYTQELSPMSQLGGTKSEFIFFSEGFLLFFFFFFFEFFSFFLIFFFF